MSKKFLDLGWSLCDSRCGLLGKALEYCRGTFNRTPAGGLCRFSLRVAAPSFFKRKSRVVGSGVWPLWFFLRRGPLWFLGASGPWHPGGVVVFNVVGI